MITIVFTAGHVTYERDEMRRVGVRVRVPSCVRRSLTTGPDQCQSVRPCMRSAGMVTVQLPSVAVLAAYMGDARLAS